MRKFSALVHRITPHTAWLMALLWGMLLTPALAERRKQPPVGAAPPQPVQLNVKVRREGKTEIPLSIHGQANEALKFLIRVPPQHGKAADPRQTAKETATTVYEPPADLDITADRFFYAVQSNAGVSAPVEVVITIVDQPPQLKIPDSLDFSTVRTGDTATQHLEISNIGGSLAIGEVVVEAPWRIEGKPAYRLAAGDIAIFKVVFAPSTGGIFERVARFTSDPMHSTILRGKGETSVTASPAEVVLQGTATDPVRTGTLTLINQTDDPRHVALKGGERLQVPPEVSIPPRGRIEVPVQTAAGDVRVLQAEIQIVAPDLELRVPVSATAPGPILRIAPRAIVFGKVQIKPNPKARFEVANVGGAPGEIFWTIGSPFRTSQNSAFLLPGEKRGFDLELEAKSLGPFRTQLQCKTGGQTFDIPVDADVVAVAYVAKGPRFPAADPGLTEDPAPVVEEKEAPPELTPIVPTDWFSDPKLPEGVTATALGPTTASIEWPASLSLADRFRVDLRQFYRAPDGSLAVSWMELGGLEIKKSGETYRTVIRDFQPGQPWTIRVSPVKADGTAEARLFAIDFATPSRNSFLPRISPVKGMWFAVLALLAWRVAIWWRSRRAYAS